MPEPLSAEQLAEIRARHNRTSGDGEWRTTAHAATATDVGTLLAEVDRLTAKVQRYEVASPRYFVRLTGGPEREVTKEEFVSAERAAGFRNTMGQPDEPATSGFGGRGVEGRIEVQR